MPGLRSLLLTLTFGLALGVAWLISTTDGARWLAARGEALVPGLQLSVVSGTLWDGLVLADVAWSADDRRVTAGRLALEWRPDCLLRWQVCIKRLTVVDVEVDWPAAPVGPEKAAEPSAEGGPLDALPERIHLPDLSLPVDVLIEGLRIERVAIRRGGDAGDAPALALSVVDLAARLVDDRLTVEHLDVAGGPGQASLSGEVVSAGAWPVDLRWSVQPDGALTAGESLRVAGRLTGEAADLELSGELSGARTARFDIGLRLLGPSRQVNASIEAEQSRLALDARLNDTLQLDGRFQAPSLEAFWPGLSGGLEGRFEVSGEPLRPSVTGTVTATAIAYQGLALAQADLDADWSAHRGGEIDLQVLGLMRDDTRLGDLRLSLQGEPARHRLVLTADDGPIAARLVARGAMEAGADAWAGTITEATVTAAGRRWRMTGAPSLDIGAERVRLAGHCWVWQDVRVCAEPLLADPDRAQARLRLARMPLALLEPHLPEGFALPGEVTGTAAFDWQRDTGPSARVTLVSADGRIEVPQDRGDGALSLDYDRIVIDADLRPDQANLRLGLASPAIGTGGIVVQTDPSDAARPIDGIVWLDGVPLAPLAATLPQLRRVRGVLQARGELHGTLADPVFRGSLRLADGELLPSALVTPLEAINLTARIDGRVATLAGGFQAGDGEASVDGRLDWEQAELRGRIDLRGEDLAIDVGTLAELTVSPAMSLEITPQTLRLSGELRVPAGELRLDQRAPGAVRVSPDAVLVDDAGEPLVSAEVDAGGRTLESDLRLVLGDAVTFSAQGATGRLGGELRLRQIGAEGAEGEGVLNILDASYEAYGQSLSIRRGRLIFAGPLARPRLDIEAVRESADILAGLRVTGPADDPQVRLFSRPTMPQASILSYLVTGRPPGQGTPSEEALLSRAALSLGVFGGGRMGSAIAEELGVEDFQLEATGQGEDAQVAVSGYLAPNLMVRYGVGVFQPQNTLSLRYYLTGQLYLEAVSGAENALDLFYSFNYD
ncbi:translocation/assembly module TamB domain-containing protein [Spiribacter onubensis]|uniref:Translocation/assembly module TamB domain-containing protein n=1 Tax=Spiribacter onubensis TaxID=3122420 RepID=A0ABV3S914_9GAMM